jgi:hypothetical protein
VVAQEKKEAAEAREAQEAAEGARPPKRSSTTIAQEEAALATAQQGRADVKKQYQELPRSRSASSRRSPRPRRGWSSPPA